MGRGPPARSLAAPALPRHRRSRLAAGPLLLRHGRACEWIRLEAGRSRRSAGTCSSALLPAATIPDLPPFQGGLAGLFGYGLCHTLERIPRPRIDEFRTPDLAVGVYDWVISFDHRQEQAWIVSYHADHGRAIRELLTRSPTLLTRSSGHPVNLALQHPLPGFPGVTSNFDRAGYVAAVRRAVEYVHAGDCFQVNLAQRLLAPLTRAAARTVRPPPRAQPGPVRRLLRPRRLRRSPAPRRSGSCSVDARGEVETRPIKGTRPRGRTPDEDAATAANCSPAPRTGPRTS